MQSAVILYALGGGAGHAARAAAFCRRFTDAAGHRVVLLHSTRNLPSPLPEHVTAQSLAGQGPRAVRSRVLELLRATPSWLVVDSFPVGLFHELSESILALAERRTLLRRFVKPEAYAGYHRACARFEEVIVPYTEARSEWLDDRVPYEHHCGPLVRALAIEPGPRVPLAVVGDASELGPRVQALLPQGTRFVEGSFTSLPSARGYLATQAGYNLSYELASLEAPLGLMPRDRRFDDQFRRANLVGEALHHGDDVRRWIERLA